MQIQGSRSGPKRGRERQTDRQPETHTNTQTESRILSLAEQDTEAETERTTDGQRLHMFCSAGSNRLCKSTDTHKQIGIQTVSFKHKTCNGASMTCKARPSDYTDLPTLPRNGYIL